MYNGDYNMAAGCIINRVDVIIRPSHCASCDSEPGCTCKLGYTTDMIGVFAQVVVNGVDPAIDQIIIATATK